MARDLIPASFFRFPTVWDDDDFTAPVRNNQTGLSISEDGKNVYVEAALPGVDPKDVDITFDKGVLWIKGESKEIEENKKYYRKAASSFSYQIAIPGEIDLNAEPTASGKNGVMKITFLKSAKSQPKKITVK